MFESKYGEIKAEKTKFLENEPLFLLRAKDQLAPRIVRYYGQVCCFLGITTMNKGLKEIGEKVKQIAIEMENWQHQNTDKVKLPD